METRAHHLLIGTFISIMLAGTFVFVLWLSRTDFEKSYDEYDIYFEGSVTGLQSASDVRFKGIPVGDVVSLRIAPDDPEKVLARVRIDEQVPILKGSTASIEILGLTGVAYVQINSGPAGNPPLEAEEGQSRPVIPSTPSALEEIFGNVPKLVEAATTSVRNLGEVLNEENRAVLAAILQDVKTVTGEVAEQSGEIETIIALTEDTLGQLNLTLAAVEDLSRTADGLADEELRLVLREADDLAKSARGLTDELQGLVRDNRGQIANFTSSTLPEITLLIQDARQLSASLTRLAERLEENPSQLIFGGGTPEFEGN